MSQETLAQARARNIRDALEEDIGPCDWTAQLIAPDTRAEARLRVREAAVLCGQEWFSSCITQLDPKASIHWHYQEGAMMPADAEVCEIAGNARALLTAERPAMNFLQLLSATATQTRAFADAIAGVSPNPRGCVVLDTRKTMPGLRQAQKYAVRIGGGANQRLALWDGILIKENHILAAGGIAAALRAARALNAAVSIQIEVESLDELRQALDAGAESILIDNFSLQEMRDAVSVNRGRALLEASGGISLESIRAVAATGVDRISVGSITKDVKAIDFSLRVTARQDQPAG
ncbi:MAG: carboxylating nicotinate-nucleotide diphosphorylase [Betaproteobacteria bacterium]|nr:carboxylating nicotinate-nucleotide diphosphorylase [Betaproteobacteria bacterium]